MSNYLTEEQEKLFATALVCLERREALETIADALDGKTPYREEYKHFRKRAGAYDSLLWEAIISLTGKDVGEFCPYDVEEELEEALQKKIEEAPDFPADQ